MRPKDNSPRQILNQIQSLVAEAEEKLVDTSTDALDSLRDRVDAIQESVTEAYDGARKKVVAGAKYADTTVRDNPYQTAAICAGIGLLVGYALGRRR